MQFWPPDDEHMCSKHVEAWNKLIVKQKFCVSSWLITEINILRRTVSKSMLSSFLWLSGFVWVRMWIGGGFLWTRAWTFRFVKVIGIPLPSEQLTASEWRLCAADFIQAVVSRGPITSKKRAAPMWRQMSSLRPLLKIRVVISIKRQEIRTAGDANGKRVWRKIWVVRYAAGFKLNKPRVFDMFANDTPSCACSGCPPCW